jgi:hypothetical protein
MEPKAIPSPKPSRWIYTEIFVHDGDRVLKPTQVCGNEISFADAPKLLSAQISIRIRTGDRQTIHAARVLPHAPDAVEIPILLIQTEQKAPAKLTA